MMTFIADHCKDLLNIQCGEPLQDYSTHILWVLSQEISGENSWWKKFLLNDTHILRYCFRLTECIGQNESIYMCLNSLISPNADSNLATSLIDHMIKSCDTSLCEAASAADIQNRLHHLEKAFLLKDLQGAIFSPWWVVITLLFRYDPLLDQIMDFAVI